MREARHQRLAIRLAARESQPIAKDRMGQEIVDLEGNPLFITEGVIHLYHGTSRENAEEIVRTNQWNPVEPEVFFSNHKHGASGFGPIYVHVVLRPKVGRVFPVRLDDAYRNGEVHLAMRPRDVQRYGTIVGVEK